MKTPFTPCSPVIANRGVHLDLKGTPPTFSRLLELLDLFAALRYNLILVEWEDAFPWSIDPSFRSATAYTEDEVRQFAEKAERLGLELVPLVQTLGHMENFLKSPEHAALREVETRNDVLNPLASGAQEFVQAMIADILRLLPLVRRFHLGGDEAWHLGTHPDTAAFIKEWGAAALYMHHMQPLLDLLNQRDIRPLLWHDMMNKWEDEPLRRLAGQCDLVVWGYLGHPDDTSGHFNSRHTARFAELGFTLWGGTAFKGGDGSSMDRPNLKARIKNGQAWVEIARRYQFTGMITTGWSRYCYDTCQCETLEASLDALLVHALQMHNGISPEELPTEAPFWLGKLWRPEEGERFKRIREAAEHFAKMHRLAWDSMRMYYTHLGAISADPNRRLSEHYVQIFMRHLSNAQEAAGKYRATLENLVPGPSLDTYFAERLTPLKELQSRKGL